MRPVCVCENPHFFGYTCDSVSVDTSTVVLCILERIRLCNNVKFLKNTDVFLICMMSFDVTNRHSDHRGAEFESLN